MTVNGVGYTPSVAAVMDRGKNAAAFDGMDLRAGGNLYWNGALRFVVGDGVSMGYDQNGNMSYKVDGSGASIYQYDHENRLESVTRNGALQESYLYDDSGQGVKKVCGGTAWYYPFPLYEIQVTTAVVAATVPVTATQAAPAQVYLPHVGTASNSEAAAVNATNVYKYYLFHGQRMAMTVNGALRYLHADQLGSTVLTTYTSGARESERGYYAFGSDRRVMGTPATDHRFTGQKAKSHH